MKPIIRLLPIVCSFVLIYGCQSAPRLASVEGTVTSIDGTVLPDVHLSMSGNIPILIGNKSILTQTDELGTYSYKSMPDGVYKVIPVSDAYKFSPPEHAVLAARQSLTGQDFIRYEFALWIRDADADGFGDDSDRLDQEEQPEGYVARPENPTGSSLDCNDEAETGAEINPGVEEVLNNDIDENCDGITGVIWYQDKDGDNFGNDNVWRIVDDANGKPAGYVDNNLDCDDSNPKMFPAFEEDVGGFDNPNNSLDENCNGFVARKFYADEDNDSFGHKVTHLVVDEGAEGVLTQPEGHVVNNHDCDDSSDAVYPGHPEVMENEIDDNCDGYTDVDAFYPDNDRDGFGDLTGDSILSFRIGYVPANFDPDGPNGPLLPDAETDHDCDNDDKFSFPAAFDSAGNEYPGGREQPDSKDQNCDESLAATWFLDADEDGFGNAAIFNDFEMPEDAATAGHVASSNDCNDDPEDPEGGDKINPAATEIPEDGIDQNCDGDDASYWYVDGDLDGFADPDEAKRVTSNDNPSEENRTQYVRLDVDSDGKDDPDCNDNDPNTYPGAFDGPNDSVDQDCDGTASITWYLDADSDGYGRDANDGHSGDAPDMDRTKPGETQPVGYSANDADCDDGVFEIAPNIPEVRDEFDAIDEDCDGFPMRDWFRDLDGDGLGDPDIEVMIESEGPQANYVENNKDCDDTHYNLTDNCL